MAWDGIEQRRNDPVLARLDDVVQRLDTLNNSIHGTNATPGLRMRVDRLEQSKRRQDKYHIAWATAAISACVAWFVGK